MAPTPALLTSKVMLASVRKMSSTRAMPSLSPRSAATTSTVRPVSVVRRDARAIKPVAVAGDKDEVITTPGKAIGIYGADAGRGASDEGCALVENVRTCMLLR